MGRFTGAWFCAPWAVFSERFRAPPASLGWVGSAQGPQCERLHIELIQGAAEDVVLTTILTGVFVGTLSAFANINEMVELTNIGTLFAFVLVSLGVLILRRRDPHRSRPFRVPGSPFVEIGAALSCLYLMTQLPAVTWIRFVVWLLVGGVIYFAYGRRHSRLNTTGT